MKLINMNTKQFTTIKVGQFDELLIKDAADRLANRVYPNHGHYSDSAPSPIIGSEIESEVVRSVGGMTEHTGIFMTLRVEK